MYRIESNKLKTGNITSTVNKMNGCITICLQEIADEIIKILISRNAVVSDRLLTMKENTVELGEIK